MSLQEKYYRHGPNLALFRSMGDMQSHWDRHWMSGSIKTFLDSSRSGYLGEFEYLFKTYLPKDGKILDAGCAPGRFVAALQARGYDIEGIDYAAETVKAILGVCPDLKVRIGDIFSVDRSDCSYSGYISIGVVEHNFSGPMAALTEAHRILRPRGVAIITVPYLNVPRKRLWRRLGEAPSSQQANGLQFYQDHLDAAFFQGQLQEAGFQVDDVCPYELFGGLIRDSKLGRFLNSRHFFSWRIRHRFRTLCRNAPLSVRRRYSHMVAFICTRV